MSSNKRNLELLSIIWLDKFGDATQENREIEEKLRSIINYVRIFDNHQSCLNYLENEITNNDKILFIVSGQLGQEIVEHIHHLTQIISIFIFCGNKQKYQSWAFSFPKIKNVIVEVDSLLKEIKNDLTNGEYQFNQSIEITTNQNKILENILLVPTEIEEKRYFLNICSKFYENNLKEKENIDEFEHLYNNKDALKYYFNETFLKRLLNRCLIEMNIEMIFILRFYLQDLEEQMKELCLNKCKVYFGQLMKMNQIEKLNNFNSNEIFQFNSFIKANSNEEFVLNLLESCSNSNSLQKVLFEIDSNGKLFQNQIIFSINSSFRFVSIRFDKRIWFVQLNLIHFNNSQIDRKLTPIQFAHFCRIQGFLDQAEKLFRFFLNEKSSLIYYSYEGIARVKQDQALYDQSLQFYIKSREFLPLKERVNCLNNFGCIYDYLQLFDKAIHSYQKSLSFVKSDQLRAMILNNIAITFAKLKQFDQSIEYFQQSLQIRKRILPSNHSIIAISFANIAFVYFSLQQFDRSLQYFNDALDIFQVNNSLLYKSIVLQNLAQIYQILNQSNKALQFYEDSLYILQQFKPNHHPNLSFIQNQIQLLKQNK